MQQQQHKRQNRSSSRYRITPASGGGGGGTIRSSSAICGIRPLNGQHDYTETTNQQQPNRGGAIVKTFKTSAAGEGGALLNTKYSGNRNLNKNKNNSNNKNNTSLAATEVTAGEFLRKRQHTPEKRFRTINGVAAEALFDRNDTALLDNSYPTYADAVSEGHEDDIITNCAELRKLLNESQTSKNPLSNTLVKIQPKSNNNHLLPLNLFSLTASLPTVQTSVRPTITTAYPTTPTNNSNPFGSGYINVEALLLQRLQLIRHFLRLTAASVGGLNQRAQHTIQAEEVTPTATSVNNLAKRRALTKSLMVHENKPENMERDVVVNSTSLEDVAHSESGDNRAQSIQSIHSVETPTPEDNTPSFDELQQRLETSNRNIQNMQEQQQQLLRLQNAAKQHLSEMEHLRQQAGTLSFGGGGPNQTGGSGGTTDGAPEYESIDQVHSDMATLVGRMKNLTTFIQNQNELSSLLGDDGPEILAEQEALQRKLESLREQRDDMRTLVNELQSINRTAERRVAGGGNESEEVAQTPTAAGSVERESLGVQNMNGERVVPVTYTRNVPIKLANGCVAQSLNNTRNKENDHGADGDDDDPEEKAATALLIQQKVADIETMRKQLRRLKEMMDTVNTIEAQTSHDVNDIGHELRSQSRSTNSSGASFDRECTPVSVVRAHHLRGDSNSNGGDEGGDDAYLTRKMRMINEVTSDLRAQAESLQAERNRIKALKEEIIMRKQQAADAAQLGEDALKRSSLTPTPTPRSREQRDLDSPSPPPAQSTTQANDPLKLEYEAKKREFEILCQRLQQQDDTAMQSQANNNTSSTSGAVNNIKAPRHRDTVSEADDEADGDEELIDSDFPTSNATSTARQYLTAPHQQSTPAQQHRAAVKAAVTAHTLATGTATNKINTSPPHQNQRLSKEDSFETNITTSSAGERRHSTLANATNTTHDGASIEAGSMQSGSSAFSMPPPMPSMGACSSWPPMPPLPNTWNPQYYYGFGPSAAPSHAPNATQPNSATTHGTGAPFTPVGLLPQSAANSDCICSGANSATNAPIVTGGQTQVPSSVNTAAQLAADPVLLHQFVQTQQMLINSVCQCNQMLWHQQREIDALNQTIHVLQERLHTLTSNGVNSVPLNDLPFSIRAESVPPPTLTAGTLPNNIYLSSTNRAQSEQPNALFPPGMNTAATTAARNSAFTNYQHHQQQQQQYQQRQSRGIISAVNGGGAATNSYNFSSETQHSNIATASSTNASLYSTLNNAAVQPPPPNHMPPASHYNNEVPQSPPLHGPGNAAGPGPIFMHHHNNAIHQNNANLRTQNHYANNLLHQQQQLPPQQQQQQQHGHSNINIGGGGGANTLNNQVPPGNRANNYWDNFRSYSRQNLLSTNSNKSNEEQQQQNQQQQSQHQHYLQQRAIEHLEPPSDARYSAPTQPHPRPTTVLPTAAPLTTSNLQQLQRQQQQQPEEATHQQQQQRSTQTQPQMQRMYSSIAESNNSNSCNNLDFERNASNNKYLRTLQRSHINRYQQQQQQQNISYANSTFAGNHNNLYQSWLPHAGADANATGSAGAVANNDDVDENAELEVYEPYNIIDSDLSASSYAHLTSNICTNSSNMLRNMNVNYGNSPHYQRNKLLAKPNCRGYEDGLMEQHNLNRARQQQQQQQQQQRLLTQQHLALRAQQQLDQSTLRPIPNMAAFKPACYLDLLPATVSEAVATAEARLRNRERVDMLLRTVTAAAHDDGDDDDAVQATLPSATDRSGATTFNSPYMPQNSNCVLLLDSNEIGNNIPNIDNENAALNGDDVNIVHEDDDAEEEDDDEDEDDTTSEEIKRNLLVNALKNDKFTTKFYESIKEDVFRRLERILLERESAEGNRQGGGATVRLCNGLVSAPNGAATANAIDVCNDVLSGCATAAAGAVVRDPTRKFNLNARMGNQQQQQRLQQYHHQQQQQEYQQQQHRQQQQYQLQHSSAAPSSQLAVAAQAALANCYQIQQELANEQAAEDDQHVMPPPLAAIEVNANNLAQAAGVDENTEEDEFSANNADTESNKADNEDAAAASAATPNFSHVERMPDLVQTRESEQPEEDNVTTYSNNQSNNNNDNNNNDSNNGAASDATIVSVSTAGRAEGNIANWRKNMLNHADCNGECMMTATGHETKRKNPSECKNNSGAGGDAEAMPVANNSASNSMRSTYYTDLIAYIITRIRNQTHTNTQINDTVLVEISKLTASAVQNFAPTLVNYKSLSSTSPHISPKKFYMKIKKQIVPRQRDDFLQWYQNYLENLFPCARSEADRRREEMRNNSGLAVATTGVTTTAALVLPRMSDKVENHKQVQQQQQQHKQQSSSVNSNTDNNDEDLAEADQNSANSSSNTIDTQLDLITDGACAQSQQQQQQQQESQKYPAGAVARENELENNENPDDDDTNDTNARTSTNSKGNASLTDTMNGVGAAAAATIRTVHVSSSSARSTAAAITDAAISAALQQSDLLRYITDAAGAAGSNVSVSTSSSSNTHT